MIPAVILICIATAVTSAPTSQQYTINVDGPEGRHVQMGEPGKAVSGYYTSRSLDGLMEYKTMYEADEKGYRATGDHLPVAAVLPAVRSLDTAPAGYVFKYEAPGSHSHYMMGEPGKSVQGSFTYTDAQGRSQRVDYEADEKGYRVKPTKKEEEPVAIASTSDAEVVKAAPAVEVAAEPAPTSDAEVVKAAESVVPASEPILETVAAPIAPVPENVAVADVSSRTAAEETPVAMMYYPKDTVAAAEPATRTIPEGEQPAPMMYYPKDAEVSKVVEPETRTIPENQPAAMMYYPKDAARAPEPASRTIPEGEQSAPMMYYPKDAEVVKAAEPETRTIPENEKPVYMMYYIKDGEVAKEAEAASRTLSEGEQPAPMMYYPKDAEPATRTLPEEQPTAMMYYPKDTVAPETSGRTNEEVVVAASPVEVVATNDPAPVQPVAEAVAVASTESKTEGKAVYALPVAFPGTTYYSLPARIVQPALPAFHYAAPYSYAYGYNIGYPLAGGSSYVYAI